jgi:hypothetical protein
MSRRVEEVSVRWECVYPKCKTGRPGGPGTGADPFQGPHLKLQMKVVTQTRVLAEFTIFSLHQARWIIWNTAHVT